MEYTSPSDEEIKLLAIGLLAGAVYTDRQVPNGDDIPAVFMPLVFLSPELKEEMKALMWENEHPHDGIIYEWMDAAGPMSVNGQPIFMSMKILASQDMPRMLEAIDRIDSA